ncbi:MAG: hypothetical protein M3Y46_02140 [Actinomycetota bacterium]|nr:hypothetical protein [Actinomycetota bacterium]
MRSRPGRAWSIVSTVAAGLWALFLLPPQVAVWSGDGAPGWLLRLDALPVYDALRGGLHGVGLTDDYLVFGAAATLSFVLLWWGTGPALARLGWRGRLFGVLILATGLVSLLSYLNHPVDAPLHELWGAEAFGLMLIGVAGVIAAFAPRRLELPMWERILLGLTLLIEVAATLVLTYYPHGTLVGLAVLGTALAAYAPREDITVAEPVRQEHEEAR